MGGGAMHVNTHVWTLGLSSLRLPCEKGLVILLCFCITYYCWFLFHLSECFACSYVYVPAIIMKARGGHCIPWD